MIAASLLVVVALAGVTAAMHRQDLRIRRVEYRRAVIVRGVLALGGLG